MFRNDLYMHQRDSIRFALFLMTLDSRVRAQGGARGQDLGHPIFFFFFYAPNFEEVEGAYWFGSVRAVSQSVCQSVSLSVCL